MIDTSVPYSDGWWLNRLYQQLRVQQERCEGLDARFRGDSPLPVMTSSQRQAVALFVEKCITNFERVIVDAVLNRLRIVGIQTGADSGTTGDAKAYQTWKTSRGKLWTREVLRMALSMSLGYVIVGRDDDGNLLVTAEDPRYVTAITDPANPYKVLAALKLFHDEVADQDIAYLYLPGRVMVARRDRKSRPGAGVTFSARYYDWDDTDTFDPNTGDVVRAALSGPIPELALLDDNGEVTGGLLPVVPFVNDRRRAQFEDFIKHIDRIHQQVLQRMTIATVQAFRQRAFKGLPKSDPKTGIDYNWDQVFTADPGAVWALPAGVEMWESEQADWTPVITGIRDDIKDLYATAGVPGYLANPDAANAAAEAASLQREKNIDNVETCQDVFEPSLDLVMELVFRYQGQKQRAKPGNVSMMWGPAERYSLSEAANAIAQTTGTLSRRQKLIRFLGMTPTEADQALAELEADFEIDQKYSLKATPAATPADPAGETAAA